MTKDILSVFEAELIQVLARGGDGGAELDR